MLVIKTLLADKNYVIYRSARNDRVFNDFGNLGVGGGEAATYPP